jgi:hypothetical protein
LCAWLEREGGREGKRNGGRKEGRKEGVLGEQWSQGLVRLD